MEYTLSTHAKEKIEKRKIPLELIDKVLFHPEQTIEQDEITIYQSIFEIDNKEYILRVFVNTYIIPNLIVTVYLTNKISKYWRA